METATSTRAPVFFTQNWQRKRPQEYVVFGAAVTTSQLIELNYISVGVSRFVANLSQSIDAPRKWNRFSASSSTGSLNGRRLEGSPRRQRAATFFTVVVFTTIRNYHWQPRRLQTRPSLPWQLAWKRQKPLWKREASKIRHYCGFKCLSPRATDPLFWSGSRARCVTLSRINNS